MNTSERFFRRYIFSTVRIIVLFLAVNALLVASYFVIAYLGNVATSKFPIEDFSNHIMATDGEFSADTQAKEMLNNFEAWAMILDDDGTVVWEENLPEELPRHYSSMDIALFSRWYLDDYPTNIAKRQDGLLVIGLPPESVVNYYFSFKAQYIWPMLFGLTAVFCINIFLMIYLFIRNARRVEKAMAPILRGIRHLSVGKPVHLEETGELAEINAGLNKAGDYLLKKDNTRADWIRGISHDIRTPLSVILGYASEIEDTSSLPEAVRNQAGIIRRHSERLKDLVADLNLTTKLEYSMQPMQKQSLDPIELARQVVSEVLNDGLSELYELELSEDNPGKNISIFGDQVLLNRMLNNLIRNCIVHNPDGCKIQISVGSNDASCTFSVMDNGYGVSELQLNTLNSDEDISSTQKQTDETEHGLGLKIVRQIVKAHHGDIFFSGAIPHGLIVSIHLPFPQNRGTTEINIDGKTHNEDTPYQHIVKKNEECFFKDEVNWNRTVTGLFGLQEAPVLVNLTVEGYLGLYQKKYCSIKPKIDGLLTQRNKIYAHNDKMAIDDLQTLIKKKPIKRFEVEELISYALEVSKFVIASFTKNWKPDKPVNMEDWKATLSLLSKSRHQ